MRKIKFRAFIDERLRNVTSIHWDDNGQIDFVLTTRGAYKFEDYPDMHLMQYVGVDSLGNDIYEGDILLCKDYAGHFEGIVKYNENIPAVTEEHGFVYYINIINDSVLLGNIYEINK